MVLIIKGSSLTFSAQGGARKSILSPPKFPSIQARAWREEGVGGRNPATPEREKKVDSPAALLVQSRTPQKSFLFLLEEKIRRAQIRESEENFFVGWRALASGGGAASLVPFKVGSRKVYNYSTNKK